MVIDEEARRKVSPPSCYTLILELSANEAYSIYLYQGKFVLAHTNKSPQADRLLEESDWDHFYEQIPQEPRASDRWRAM
jgi:hypothetical protein